MHVRGITAMHASRSADYSGWTMHRYGFSPDYSLKKFSADIEKPFYLLYDV